MDQGAAVGAMNDCNSWNLIVVRTFCGQFTAHNPSREEISGCRWERFRRAIYLVSSWVYFRVRRKGRASLVRARVSFLNDCRCQRVLAFDGSTLANERTMFCFRGGVEILFYPQFSAMFRVDPVPSGKSWTISGGGTVLLIVDKGAVVGSVVND